MTTRLKNVELDPAKAVAEAERLHELGYNCAESLCGAVVTAAGQEPPPLRLASAFGGGMGRTGEVCGVLTGALIGLGWLFGRDRPEDKESYARVAAMGRRLLDGFRAQHGTLDCSTLTGYDLSDPAVLADFAADGERRRKCAEFIRSAARLAAAAAQDA